MIDEARAKAAKKEAYPILLIIISGVSHLSLSKNYKKHLDTGIL